MTNLETAEVKWAIDISIYKDGLPSLSAREVNPDEKEDSEVFPFSYNRTLIFNNKSEALQFACDYNFAMRLLSCEGGGRNGS
jgi:hypothetical protein